ncbi:hypothetical protein EJ110_NYTH48343 [Nymphaea thermarum]|nr:hypothetical protein EJ110_NYTH48343 [Nymphaea thermarum]
MVQPSGSSLSAVFPLRLLVDEKKKKVVFAEAGKDLVDFFFSLMLLPLGAAVSLLGRESTLGSVGKLHESISKLDSSYFSKAPAASPAEVKEELKSPPLPCPRLSLGDLHLPYPKSSVRLLEVHMCNNCCDFASEVYDAKCPSCRREMTRSVKLVQPSADEEKGFVKELVAYAITDDLSIAPLSTFSCLALMKRLKVTDLATLQERTVMVGVEQLFDSIEKLDSSFILTESSTPEQVKEELLNPILPSKIDKVSLKKLGWNSPLPARHVMLYACGNCWYNRTRRDSYVYITFEARCSSCSSGPMKALHIVSDVAAESPSHGSSCSYYKCNTCSRLQVASVSGTPCPACPGEMCWGVTILKSIPINRISASTSSDQQRDVAGFVQGVVTYTISDDLTIAPLSTISTISLMQKLVPLRVQDLATLEERTVTVGRNEGLGILKASLHSKKVLTEVFLSKEEKVNVVRVEPVDTSSSTRV